MINAWFERDFSSVHSCGQVLLWILRSAPVPQEHCMSRRNETRSTGICVDRLTNNTGDKMLIDFAFLMIRACARGVATLLHSSSSFSVVFVVELDVQP
jgi:hypothetical protein